MLRRTLRHTPYLTLTALIALTLVLAAQDTARARIPNCNGLAWGGTCYSANQGDKFTQWLRQHGGLKRFTERHLTHAQAIFGSDWPNQGKYRWQRLDRDFHKALRHATRRFNVSYAWLHNCAHTEGGHGPAFPVGAAGERGGFQYLAGTFEFMSRSAFQTRGHPPLRYRRIDSVVGQTWTTAWAFANGLSYHWHGRLC